MLCDRSFPGEMKHTHFLTPDREPMIEQSTDATKDQLGGPVGFTGVQGYERGVTYGSRNDSKISVSPKPIPAQVTDSSQEPGNLEQSAQPTGSSTGWTCPLQVAQLISVSKPLPGS